MTTSCACAGQDAVRLARWEKSSRITSMPRTRPSIIAVSPSRVLSARCADEIGRGVDRLKQTAHALFRRLDHHGELHLAGVERDAEAVHHQQHDRHQERDQDRRWIAQDLLDLLARQRHAVDSRLAVMRVCTSAMKASSSVGSGSARVRTRARNAAGVSTAASLPWLTMPSRSQYSASSMKWLVTMTVTPVSASMPMRAQKSRRVSGSTPDVGSSRNRMSGACSSARGQRKALLQAERQFAGNAGGGVGRSKPFSAASIARACAARPRP